MAKTPSSKAQGGKTTSSAKPASQARIAKAMAADKAMDLVAGIKENSPLDNKIDAEVRAACRQA